LSERPNTRYVLRGPSLIVVRVRRRDLAVGPLGLRDAERAQRARVELHGQRRLSHGDEALPDPRKVDVGVVRRAGREHGHHPPEDRPAGVGGELAVGDPSLSYGRVRPGLELAVGVADRAVGEAEAVQHRLAVKPMIEAASIGLEPRRAGADQRAPQPRRQLALDGQAIDGDLVLEGPKSGGVVSHRRSHRLDLMIQTIPSTLD
jgi:hypothetical protein